MRAPCGRRPHAQTAGPTAPSGCVHRRSTAAHRASATGPPLRRRDSWCTAAAGRRARRRPRPPCAASPRPHTVAGRLVDHQQIGTAPHPGHACAGCRRRRPRQSRRSTSQPGRGRRSGQVVAAALDEDHLQGGQGPIQAVCSLDVAATGPRGLPCAGRRRPPPPRWRSAGSRLLRRRRRASGHHVVAHHRQVHTTRLDSPGQPLHRAVLPLPTGIRLCRDGQRQRHRSCRAHSRGN